MDNPNNKFFKIDDDTLINFYCSLIKKKKIEFIKEMENFDIYDEEIDEMKEKKEKYINIDNNKLLDILTDLLEEGKNKEQIIVVFKMKKLIFQKLWTHFVRNAIKFLRFKDLRDRGKLKFDFGVKNLNDYFEDFSKFEELLYGIDDYYRDHSLHVFRVYLLGEYIIRKILKGSYDNLEIIDQPKLENEKKNKIIEINNKEKEAMWCVISLCHDLGYPLQKINKLNQKLAKILKYFGAGNFERVRFNLPLEGTILDKFILKILSSKMKKICDSEFKLHVQSKFYTKYSNAYEKLFHGIMSGILLMKNLVYFKEMDYKDKFCEKDDEDHENYLLNAKQYLIRREILRAIASHDCVDIYHISMNNFLFLLIICDEIQDWSRPFSKKRTFFRIENKRQGDIRIYSFDIDNLSFSIRIDLTNTELEKYAKDKIRKFIKLLRSALDSDKRIFDFKMIIKNYNDLCFQFRYDNPKEFYQEKPFSIQEPIYYPKPQVIKDDKGERNYYYLNEIIKF